MATKRLLIYLGWFVAGAALGELSDIVFFPFWFKLSWREPVAEWLWLRGWTKSAGYWGLVWIRIPECLVAGSASVVAGLFVRQRLVIKIVVFSLALFCVPTLVTMAQGVDLLSFGMHTVFRMLVWDLTLAAFAIALAISVAAVRSRLRKEGLRGFDVSAMARSK